MTNAVTTITPHFTAPYVTVAEYKQAPTAIDVNDLVGGGSAALNDQELANVIRRASGWIDSHCNQVLASTVDTDSMRGRIDRRGFITIHPRFFPITQVVSLSYGALPNLMASVDTSLIWIENQQIVFQVTGLSSAFLGPIQFSGNYSTTREQFYTLTYDNGYPNTTLTASVTASASTLPVADLTGFAAGMTFEVYDGSATELLTVSSTFTPSSGSGSLPLATPTTSAHTALSGASALPPAVKQACISLTSSILKARGNAALVMQGLTPSTIQPQNPSAATDIEMAWDLLKPYRRVR